MPSKKITTEIKNKTSCEYGSTHKYNRINNPGNSYPIDILISIIAHEFNNIAGLIQGYVELYNNNSAIISSKNLAVKILKQTDKASDITGKLLRIENTDNENGNIKISVPEIAGDLLKSILKKFKKKRITAKITCSRNKTLVINQM
ncbi:MAG: hypothetical protein ABIA63_08140, partial [bacterium]